jgi:mannose-6-phosphate isomerase-like protein (cupin superfamily)
MRYEPYVAIAALFLVGFATFHRASLAQAGAVNDAGWILERNEGEKRIRRPRGIPLPASTMTIKVDRKNGGSQHLVLITEGLPPGSMIPRHKHFDQDEILLIQTSTAHVWLGDSERDVSAGAVIYIPSDTWITLKNTGNENLSLVAIFSAPGFDEYVRCTSVPEGQQPSTMNQQEWKECQHKGHAEFVGDPKLLPK